MPWGTSSAFPTPLEIHWHLQCAGEGHEDIPAPTADFEPPQSKHTQGDRGSDNGTDSSLSPSHMNLWHLLKSILMQSALAVTRCHKGSRLPNTSCSKSSWTAGASHWNIPLISPNMTLNQMYSPPLCTIALKIRK